MEMVGALETPILQQFHFTTSITTRFDSSSSPTPTSTSTSVAVSSSSSSSKYANPEDFLPHKAQSNSSHQPHLFLSKPSFIVRSQSNVRIERRRRPEPSCVICEGSGRVDCYHCHGKGRTNYTDLVMLPLGEWPKWCKTCGGSGLGYCPRCLGTGEYRDTMGFHFMKREKYDSRDNVKHQVTEKAEHLSAADSLLSQTTSDPKQ